MTAPTSPMITGHTSLIAHIGWPTHAFRAPAIYNRYFEHAGIDCVVVPMGCRTPHYPALLRALVALENFRGALITMPHKVSTVALLDEAAPAVRIAGACNAVRRDEHGRIVGDLFDGEGFVRGLRRKGLDLHGTDALVVGTGGVGSAIAASLVAAGIGSLGLFDAQPLSAQALAERLTAHYPALRVRTGSHDPAGFGLVVNATPLGMDDADPLPVDVSRLEPGAFVGEVVMKREQTALVAAARARGCQVQVGVDMLFEQIPAYLEFFGLPTTTPQLLRSLCHHDQ